MANESIQSGGRQRSGSWCREREDVQLLASAKSGQVAAFPKLWRSYAKKILRTTSHYQESGRCGTGRFLHIEHFEERSSFSTWLKRISDSEKNRSNKFIAPRTTTRSLTGDSSDA